MSVKCIILRHFFGGFWSVPVSQNETLSRRTIEMSSSWQGVHSENLICEIGTQFEDFFAYIGAPEQ